MNKVFLLLLAVFLSEMLNASGEDRTLDIIYLKNKTILEGEIVKNTLGEISLKIEKDGEIQILKFQYYEIDKIERREQMSKEQPSQRLEGGEPKDKKVFVQSQLASIALSTDDNIKADINSLKTDNNPHQLAPQKEQGYKLSLMNLSQGTQKSNERDLLAPVPDKKALREWIREIRGFRGFLEVGYNFGLDKVRNNTIDITKSVGFQFNPLLYLGIGTTYKISTNRESSLPVFLNPRLNMTDNEEINPYWDIKIGYSMLQAKGTYFSTSLGSSFVIGKKDQFAINLGLTYSFLNAAYFKNDIGANSRIKIKEDYHQLGLSICFEY